ncbi:MAG: cupredoxin domain-containing protein [Patescibacteria group bacterium]
MAEKEDTVSISKIKLLSIIIAFVLLAGIAALFFISSAISFSNPFAIATLLSIGVIGYAALFAYSKREKMSEMHCMMNGMAFGMMASFVIGVLAALPTGDFVLGIIIGTVAGLIAAIPIGNSGGQLARMEGVMAAPMGGSMGAMTGIMIRFYNVQLFMAFLFVMLVLVMYEMTRVNSKHCECSVPRSLKYFGILVSAIAIISIFSVAYSIDNTADGGVLFAGQQRAGEEQQAQAQVAGNVQEIDMKISALGYDPNYIVVKKDIPVKINLQADNTAGCTRSIVFRDFGIQKTVPRGGSDVIEFTPTRAGTYQFSCSMNMARGTLIVQ